MPQIQFLFDNIISFIWVFFVLKKCFTSKHVHRILSLRKNAKKIKMDFTMLLTIIVIINIIIARTE